MLIWFYFYSFIWEKNSDWRL